MQIPHRTALGRKNNNLLSSFCGFVIMYLLPLLFAPALFQEEKAGNESFHDNQLPVAEKFESPEKTEPEEVANPPVALVDEVVEKNRAEVDPYPPEDGEEEKEHDELAIDGAEQEEYQENRVSEKFDDRTERLHEEKIREGDQADFAVTGIEEHLPVVPEAVDEPPLPAVPLLQERFQVGRDLGPADWIGDEYHLVSDLLLVTMAVQPDYQVHVLAHGLAVASDRLNHVLAEDAEGPGDDEETPEETPGGPAGEESPRIFHRLETLQDLPRRLHFRDHPVF